jgi:excinuclease ABC subunit B
MKKLIDETAYRRTKQMAYNEKHGITPQTVKKANKDIFQSALGSRQSDYEQSEPALSEAAEAQAEYMSKEQLEDKIKAIRKQMEKAAKELDFIEAARLRDEMFSYQALKKERFS